MRENKRVTVSAGLAVRRSSSVETDREWFESLVSKLQHITSQGVKITVALPLGRDRLTHIETKEIFFWLKSILEQPKPLATPQLEIQTDVKTETKEFGVVKVRPPKAFTLGEYWKIKEAERARNGEQRE